MGAEGEGTRLQEDTGKGKVERVESLTEPSATNWRLIGRPAQYFTTSWRQAGLKITFSFHAFFAGWPLFNPGGCRLGSFPNLGTAHLRAGWLVALEIEQMIHNI